MVIRSVDRLTIDGSLDAQGEQFFVNELAWLVKEGRKQISLDLSKCLALSPPIVEALSIVAKMLAPKGGKIVVTSYTAAMEAELSRVGLDQVLEMPE